MIPEMSAAARYRKAPYAVQAGDFSSAGSVEFAPLDRLDSTLLALTGDEDHIPGAIESTFSLGLDGACRNGVTASLRLRHLGRSPLIEDNSVRTSTSTLMNAGVAWRTGRLENQPDAFNLREGGDYDIS
jgi:hypothetical protein